jgi:hypothetical protein
LAMSQPDTCGHRRADGFGDIVPALCDEPTTRTGEF